MKRKQFKPGDTVRYIFDDQRRCATVTQVTRWKLRVLYPVHHYTWLERENAVKVGR
jgi:hypothetical protein